MSETIATNHRAFEFATRYADVLSCLESEWLSTAKRVLVVGGGVSSRIEMELCLIKALAISGCRPMSLIVWHPEKLRAYYSLLPPSDIYFLSKFEGPTGLRSKAEMMVNAVHSLDELSAIRLEGVRIGGHAVSSARRQLREGTVDLQLPSNRNVLINCLALSMAAAASGKRIIEELKPSLILTEDTAYTPRGEILDTSVQAGVPVVRWYTAHKSSALMLKRYTKANRDHDINSLSDASWRTLREIEWGDKGGKLKREINKAYETGDWYNEDGAQSGKHVADKETVRGQLGLDPGKKTAFIFPHIGWDASFGRGEDLFQTYDEWLVATVRAACANERVQWVIKIHPAHVGKITRDQRATTEADVLRKCVGNLPPHITLIPAQTDISTLSLFPVMDYCLTVRGTVGLEAACLGIPVLTGGTGRYDRKGFTIDSATTDEYLKRIANIDEIPELMDAQIELAQRFAYGLFLLRPLPLSSIELPYKKKSTAENLDTSVMIKIRSPADWSKASDLLDFANWVINSDEEDFMVPI